jgi:hypothetical protein
VSPVRRLPGQDALDHQLVADGPEGTFLQASFCRTCQSTYYPPREFCPRDLQHLEDIRAPERGSLYEAVRVDMAPRGFDAPYCVCYVDFPEGIRVFGQLTWGDEPLPLAGSPMRLGIGVVRSNEDEEVIGPIFTLDRAAMERSQ